MDSEEAARLEALASVFVMRDVVARLLAYEATRHRDQRRLFEEFSAATATRIQAVTEEGSTDATTIDFQERAQREADAIVGLARRIAMAIPEAKGP